MVAAHATDVVVIRWPGESERLTELRRQHVPRLALVAPHAPAFQPSDPMEDWVRLPATNDDVRARAMTLIERAHKRQPDVPKLDDGQILRYGPWWTSLAPTETRLLGALLVRFGGVVNRNDLARAGWPNGLPSRNSLDVQLGRIRRKLDGSGLTLRTVRSRGAMLVADTSA